MKSLILAKRNLKEAFLDPLSLIFTFLLPVALLVLMQLIFGNMPKAPMFEINAFAPGIATFGFTFAMLYIGLTITNDKSHAFMNRIFASPVTSGQYLLSFVLSNFPLMMVQTLAFYLVSLIFGLRLGVGTLVSIVYLIPSMAMYMSLGLLIGAIVNKADQAGPVSSIIITATGLLGGIWMPIETIGGTFLTVCKYLPFYPGVEMARNAGLGVYSTAFPNVLIVLAYTAVFFTLAVLIFKKKSKK